jgi:hypothetical protein
VREAAPIRESPKKILQSRQSVIRQKEVGNFFFFTLRSSGFKEQSFGCLKFSLKVYNPVHLEFKMVILFS